MKLKIGLTISAILLALAVFAAGCGGGDPSTSSGQADDDDGGDDAGDDTSATDDSGDDDIDDDTVQNELTVTNFTAGECAHDKAGEPDPATEPHDMVELQWQDGVLKVKHYAAILNCCFDLDVHATQSESFVTVTETDVGDPCDCVCSNDVEYQIEGALPGDYRFTLNGLFSTKAGVELSKLDVSLDDGVNWEWGIPTMDMLVVQGDPPYLAGDPINIRVSPCYLQDQTSVQINYRVGYTGTGMDGIYFMVYDRRSLDDPVPPDPQCIFEYTDITVPDPGTYYLRANSYRLIDPLGWALYTGPSVLEVE